MFANGKFHPVEVAKLRGYGYREGKRVQLYGVKSLGMYRSVDGWTTSNDPDGALGPVAMTFDEAYAWKDGYDHAIRELRGVLP